MRAGRAEDLTPLIELWRREVMAGRQDMVPEETRIRRMLSRFDWEARSRMVDDGGRLVPADAHHAVRRPQHLHGGGVELSELDRLLHRSSEVVDRGRLRDDGAE